MKMESLDRFTHNNKQEHISQNKKLGELSLDESNVLQSKMAVLLFNQKRQEEGKGERLISSTEKKDWNEEDQHLFKQAFFEWVDASNTSRPSLSFNDYISNRYPDETIDMKDAAAVKQLFEKIMVNSNTGSLEQVVQQDLI